MQIGIVGLGRMGGGIARRLMAAGHECVVHDRDKDATDALADDGAIAAHSFEELVEKLEAPRAIWIMVPTGEITDQTVTSLAQLLDPGDTLIDGGNSFYKGSAQHGLDLAAQGIHFVDVGTSGGVWGLERGYCLMIGGPDEAVERLDPIFDALAPGEKTASKTPGRDDSVSTAEKGYLHVGPSGSGHFTKMIHNRIEYGLMQAYAEGLDILRQARCDDRPEHLRFDLEVGEISEVWRRGSVIASWLLDLTATALQKDAELSDFQGIVPDSGTGRWTIQAAVEEAVPANVLSAALYARFRSRRDESFSDQVLSAMRSGFGGHSEKG
ncbi:MAG: phosphogluconate dehydrogenase (NAD(+)-dependent, decarboxylating) [Pseudomonadota bacterium]